MTKTLENCSLIKKMVKKGEGEPERLFNINKCLGYQKGEDDDEPCEICKRCRLLASIEIGKNYIEAENKSIEK